MTCIVSAAGPPFTPDFLALSYKLSRDPLFIEKVREIVGLYLAPPGRALVQVGDSLPVRRSFDDAAIPKSHDCERI